MQKRRIGMSIARPTKEATMKTNHLIGLSLLAGVALGASAIQGLHAQAKPPVYAIVEIDEIIDPATYAASAARTNEAAAASFKDMGGRYLARTTKITGLDGVAPKRALIIRFDNAEKAQAWYNSPKNKKVNEIRTKSTKSRTFIVEGT
jgi:uncharacterized protein (DUF1330 family)